MDITLPKRKKIRLEDFDYSADGAYFITICTKNKEKILWQNSNVTYDKITPLPDKSIGIYHGYECDTIRILPLSDCGKTVECEINNIANIYGENVKVNCYVIMPNHIHIIIILDSNGRPQVAPTIDRIVKQFKGKVSKKLGKSIWQKSFFDRVIRNDQEYVAYLKYITENPAKWDADDYFC